MLTKSQKRKIEAAILYPLLILMSLILLIPLLWVLISSFKPANEIFAWPITLLPKNPTLDNYVQALSRGNFLLYFKNSFIVAVSATLLTLMINVPAGYAFAKYHFKGDKILFGIVLSTMMVPLEVIMIPVFKVIVATGMYNRLLGLIIPAIASPTSVFMVRQYYMGLPDAYMEAARIDGASEFQIMTKIMIPIAKPVISVLCIMSFQWRWNDYLWPKLVINKKALHTIQLALATFSGEYSVDWNSLLAMSIVTMLPVLIVFLTFQRYIIGGMTYGGVKE